MTNAHSHHLAAPAIVRAIAGSLGMPTILVLLLGIVHVYAVEARQERAGSDTAHAQSSGSRIRSDPADDPSSSTASTTLVSVEIAAEKRIYLPMVTSFRNNLLNSAPTAIDDSVSVWEDSSVEIRVTENDYDPDGNVLAVQAYSSGKMGTVSGTEYRSALHYVPWQNLNGSDAFRYQVTDGIAQSNNWATVNVTIIPVNDLPTVTDDSKQAFEDTALTFPSAQLTANDSPGAANESGQTLTVRRVTADALTHGSVTLNTATADITFTPQPDYNGPARFSYEVCDNGTTNAAPDPKCAAATVTLQVAAVNDPPSFVKGSNQVVREDDTAAKVVSNWATSLYKGPGNEAGQTLNFVVDNDNDDLFAVDPAISADGTLRFTVAPNVYGSATVRVYVRDNGGTVNGGVDTSPVQSFAIAVYEVNDAIAVYGESKNAIEDTPLSFPVTDLTANDSRGPANESGQLLQVTNIDDRSAHGAVGLDGGTLTYTPELNYFGPASFSYTLCDNGTTNGAPDPQCGTATVSMQVTPVNDPPSFMKGADITVAEDAVAQTVTSWATQMSTGPANESGQTTSILVDGNTNPALFSAAPALSPNGTLSFTVKPNVSGSATITVFVRDDGGTVGGGKHESSRETFVITVYEVNDPITLTDKTSATTIFEDTPPAPFPVTSLVSSADSPGVNENGQMLVLVDVLKGDQTHGDISWNQGNGTVSYTPEKDYFGPASFDFKVCDNGTTNGLSDPSCDTATFSFDVSAVNDAPSFKPGAAQLTVDENAPAQELQWATEIYVGPDNEIQLQHQAAKFTVFNEQPELFTSAPQIDPAGILRFTPAPDQTGSALITVFMEDGGATNNRTASVQFTITIR